MSIDWNALDKRAAVFSVQDAAKDPSGVVGDVVVVGLHLAMSDALALFPASGGDSLTVYADTLVMDVDHLPVRGAVVMAREVDTTAMGADALTVPRPATGTTAVEFLVGGVTGPALAVTTDGAAPTPVATGLQPLTTALFVVQPSGPTQVTTKTDDDDIGDLAGRVYALSSLRAGYAAATWLMNTGDDDALATARDMLAWVTACTGAAATSTATAPASWTELHDQALPLLTDLSVRAGTTYVPSLASDFYQIEVTRLVDVVAAYDAQLATLRTATDLKAAVSQVGAALGDVATSELAPLKSQQEIIKANIADLTTGITTLDLQLEMQSSALDAAWTKLEVAITEKQISDWFNACFELALSAVSLAFDGAKLGASGGTDLSALKGVITTGAKAAKSAYDAIASVSKDATAKQQPLLDAARKVVESQEVLVHNYVVILGLATATGVPNQPSLFAVDPATAWDNYVAEATASLSSLTVGAAASYLASLTVLANYGKALSAKVATASAQVAQNRIVAAQIEAAKQAAARWAELEKKADSDQERLAALTGVLAGRRDGIARSLFVAWTHYRAAYRYLYLVQPPVVVDLDMSTAELKKAFADTATWVAQMLGDGPAGSHIRLPDDDVDISFTFPVVTAEQPQPSVDTALFTPASGDDPATLTWMIPMGTDQLHGVLPHGGNVAIWITAAVFTVDGVTPNDKGNVIVEVSTSGTYQNGYGPAKTQTFVARSMVGSYAYKASDDGPPYDPWNVATQLTMTPTPYTQWTMAFDPDGGDASTAEAVRMDLTVSFRSAS